MKKKGIHILRNKLLFAFYFKLKIRIHNYQNELKDVKRMTTAYNNTFLNLKFRNSKNQKQIQQVISSYRLLAPVACVASLLLDGKKREISCN